MLEQDLIDQLNSKYEQSGPERVGFINEDGLVEVVNIHPLAQDFFEVSLEELNANLDKSWAIWHTQPNRTSQLSYEDYVGFLNFPEHKHIVIGLDGLRVYKVEDGHVLKDSVFVR